MSKKTSVGIVLPALVAAVMPWSGAGAAAPRATVPDDVITAEELAFTVQSVNDRAFTGESSQRRSPANFLPRSMRTTDTTDEEQFVAEEFDNATDMAEGLATPTAPLAVDDVGVTVVEATDQDGLRLVTLHVTRTLDSGVVWEELTPYAVGLPGGPLEVGEIVRYDMDALVSGEVPQALADRREVPELDGEEVVGTSDHSQPASIDPSLVQQGLVTTRKDVGSTGRGKAADYAYKYALSPNKSYHEWGNDCTNFISQAMKAGGWSHDLGWYRSDGNWWYTGGWPVKASWTWAGAENWYRFARVESKRAGVATNVYALRRGDVLQYKAAGASAMTHTMIVTSKVGNVPYLSYHTSNTRNKPFTAIDHLNVTWFGHYIK